MIDALIAVAVVFLACLAGGLLAIAGIVATLLRALKRAIHKDSHQQ